MTLPPLPRFIPPENGWDAALKVYTTDQMLAYATAAAAAARAEEREAIAQMLDQWQEDAGSMHNYWAFAARQIRARGE